MDKNGDGNIYDQFEIIKNYRRIFKGPPLTVSIIKLSPLRAVSSSNLSLPQILLERLSHWKCYAEGDLLHRFLREGNLSRSTQPMLAIEKQLLESKTQASMRLPIKTLIVRSYQAFFNWLLR
jgi:hypothetical protein